MPHPPSSSSSSLYEARDFHTGLWRTNTLRVTEHTDISPQDTPALVSTVAEGLSRESHWAYAMGRSVGSISELKERLVPYLKREVDYVLANECPEDSSVLSCANNTCVSIWRRKNPYKGLRMVKGILNAKYPKYPKLQDIFRTLSFIRDLDRHHPKIPHVYLQCFAYTPQVSRSDKDLLMEEMTERLDREGMPAYTLVSNEEKEHFYLSHGFQILIHDIPNLPRGTPRIKGLWRSPKHPDNNQSCPLPALDCDETRRHTR